MTENKRFNFVGGYLYDGNEPVGHVEDVKFRQDFEDLVNELHEEKEELIDALNQRTEQCDALHEENQQLKKMNELLIAEIRWNREKTIKDKTRRITPKEYEEKKKCWILSKKFKWSD